MTIAADLTKKIYTGNDVTTVFPYPFKIFQSTDLLVILTDTNVTPHVETLLTEGVDYTVSGVGDESGGNVTYPVSGDPLATGEKLTNWRVPAILQGTDFQNQGGFFAQTHENSLDLLTMICQYVSEFVQRAFALSVSDESGASLTIPGPVAGNVLGWNSLADALENIDPGSVALATPASDSIIANMINAAGTQATLTKLLSGNTAIWQKGADVASAAILPLLSDGNYNHVTGVDAVTSVATIGKGTLRIVKFTGILVWTHHATDLINIGAADITTAAGDHAIILEYDAGKWVMIDYTRTSSLPALLSVANTFSGANIFSGANTFSGLLTLSKVLDSGLFIVDNGDNTKKIAFEASGITAGNVRTLNMPDKDLNFDYGTYSPSVTIIANIDAVGGVSGIYTRVGDIVSVDILVQLDVTATATKTEFRASLPIPSDITGSNSLLGSGNFIASAGSVFGSAVAFGDATNDEVEVNLTSVTTGIHDVSIHFQYKIV